MKNYLIAVALASIAIFVFTLLFKRNNPIKKILRGFLKGTLALGAVNAVGFLTGVSIPISFLSLIVSTLGGIPGVATLILLNMIL